MKKTKTKKGSARRTPGCLSIWLLNKTASKENTRSGLTQFSPSLSLSFTDPKMLWTPENFFHPAWIGFSSCNDFNFLELTQLIFRILCEREIGFGGRKLKLNAAVATIIVLSPILFLYLSFLSMFLSLCLPLYLFVSLVNVNNFHLTASVLKMGQSEEHTHWTVI